MQGVPSCVIVMSVQFSDANLRVRSALKYAIDVVQFCSSIMARV